MCVNTLNSFSPVAEPHANWYKICLKSHVLICLFAINSQWLGNAIWQYLFGSTLFQVMTCWLMAPSNYLNKCWLFIKGARALGYSPQTISQVHMNLTHWGWDKMDAISQTTFSSTFSWMKMFEFRLKFHWCLFLRVELTIFQHWFR